MSDYWLIGRVLVVNSHDRGTYLIGQAAGQFAQQLQRLRLNLNLLRAIPLALFRGDSIGGRALAAAAGHCRRQIRLVNRRVDESRAEIHGLRSVPGELKIKSMMRRE